MFLSKATRLGLNIDFSRWYAKGWFWVGTKDFLGGIERAIQSFSLDEKKN